MPSNTFVFILGIILHTKLYRNLLHFMPKHFYSANRLSLPLSTNACLSLCPWSSLVEGGEDSDRPKR